MELKCHYKQTKLRKSTVVVQPFFKFLHKGSVLKKRHWMLPGIDTGGTYFKLHCVDLAFISTQCLFEAWCLTKKIWQLWVITKLKVLPVETDFKKWSMCSVTDVSQNVHEVFYDISVIFDVMLWWDTHLVYFIWKLVIPKPFKR